MGVSFGVADVTVYGRHGSNGWVFITVGNDDETRRRDPGVQTSDLQARD